jgi:hypothetical protein
MLAAAGLQDHVVVQWWRYQEPALIPRQELGLRAWVTPMAGYWSNLFTQSYSANIYPMLLYGQRAGAEGADAYAIFDLAFDRNYTCLAQYSWDARGADLYQFKSRYACSVLRGRLDAALAVLAFTKYDQAFDAMAWTETVLASLLYYWHTYPAARARGRYPFSVLVDLADEHLRLRSGLERCVAEARAAHQLFMEADPDGADPLLAQYQVECSKVIGVWESFSLLLRGVVHYRQAAAPQTQAAQAASWLQEAAQAVGAARVRWLALMAELEAVKAAYLLPQILRDLSIVLSYLDHLQAEVQAAARHLEQGQALVPFEALAVNAQDLDRLVAPVPSGAAGM